ncbi:MAG: hypothetical protein ABIT36_06955 [Steroidobacteraceae bacterium]
MNATVLHGALFVVYAVLNTAAMAFVKGAMAAGRFRSHFAAVRGLAIGGVLYLGGLAALLWLLRTADANTVFPIAIGCTVLATNVLGAWSGAEPVTGQKLIGTVLIMAGIALAFVGGAPR